MSTTAYAPPSSLSTTCIPNPNLTKPDSLPVGFDPQLAYLLGLCCSATSDQYTKYVTNTPMIQNDPNDPQNWGIESVGKKPWDPDFSQILAQGYTSNQHLNLTVYEQDENGTFVEIPAGFIVQLDPTGTGKSMIVIAFHGTHNSYELDKTDNDVTPATFGASLGSVHGGFYTLYADGSRGTSLAAQISAYLIHQNAHGILPVKVTGHSMGGALATLCAADIAYNCRGNFQSISMYSLASPRVAVDNPLDQNSRGNAAKFVSHYQQSIPDSYRIVNTSDSVPTLPPPLAIYACAHVLGDSQFGIAKPSPLDQNVISFTDPNKDRNAGSAQECQGPHSLPAAYLPFLKNLASNS